MEGRVGENIQGSTFNIQRRGKHPRFNIHHPEKIQIPSYKGSGSGFRRLESTRVWMLEFEASLDVEW
jgi:hypothetical protein